MDPESIKLLAELGVAAGGFFVMLRWLMTRFEKELSEARTQSNAQHESQLAAIAKNTRAVVAQAMAIVSLQKQFLAHDLAQIGLHPSKPPEAEQAMAILRKYEELQNIMNEVKNSLKDLADDV